VGLPLPEPTGGKIISEECTKIDYAPHVNFALGAAMSLQF
jgi:hypothetical protein